MSYLASVAVSPAVVAAALALDMLDACKNHKFKEPTAAKYHLLAQTMKAASARVLDLARNFDEPDRPKFIEAAFAHTKQLRVERAAVVKHRRLKREADIAAQQELEAAFAAAA